MARRQLLPVTGCAELKSEDILGISAVRLIQITLEACVDQSSAPLDAPPPNGPMNIHTIQQIQECSTSECTRNLPVRPGRASRRLTGEATRQTLEASSERLSQ